MGGNNTNKNTGDEYKSPASINDIEPSINLKISGISIGGQSTTEESPDGDTPIVN